jgi:octaprenyl-diphosphate synthase
VTVRTPTPGALTLRDVQAPISTALGRVNDEMWRIVAVDSDLFRGVNQHLMLMKGKMLRPTLLLLSSHVKEEPEDRSASYAAVVELIHLATLVHDDAVDHSVLRRGMPTINALLTHEVAVIAGDFLYSRAVQELVRLGDLDALRVFAKASNELTVGEMRQLSAMDALAFSEADYEFLIRAKTAALFSAACEVGALCGAAAYRTNLTSFGSHLGMAFQVVDDLLDYTEAAETLGKPAGLDLREHKVTLPLIAALRSMPASARRVVDDLFASSEPTEVQISRVIDIVRDEAGLEYARRRVDEYAARAEESLSTLPDTAARRALSETIAYVADRRS